MYPLKFDNLYFEKIWGGRSLEKFRHNLPDGRIGESWDVSCYEDKVSTVVNGDLKGKNLRELINIYGEELLGSKAMKCQGEFPLLFKIINSDDKLSVQVHPTNEYAEKVEGTIGKTEAWYVIDAKEGATLIIGTKPCTRDEFEKAVRENNVEKYLNTVKVKKGQVYFIPSGLVHSIGAGMVIAEIQRNVDITYRVYDYNRGRELQVDRSLDVIDLSLKGQETSPSLEQGQGYIKKTHIKCDYFILEEYDIETEAQFNDDGSSFSIISAVDGEGYITCKDGIEPVHIRTGESVLMPAEIKEYKIQGRVSVIKSYVG